MKIGDLSGTIERARLAGRIAIISLVLSFILAVVVIVAGPATKWAGMEIFTLSLYPVTLAFLFSVCALVHSAFLRKMAEEEQEKLILEQRKSNVNSILDVSEDVRFTAKRTLENFNKYIPSAVSLLVFLLSVPAFWYFWKHSTLGSADPATLVLTPKNPINLAFLGAISALFAYFTGVFLVGQSRIREFRYLRPVGSWLICFAIVLFVSAVSALFINYGRTGWAAPLTRIFFWILAVFAAEHLVSFIIEFYRPRTLEEVRPVYESRLLAIFTEPGGVVRNISDSLDYQFGFQISRTGIYLVLRKAIVPALMVWAAVLWLFTCIAEVNPGEIGIREVFGAVNRESAPLDAGIHFKLPWPCEKILRVPVKNVQEATLGSVLNAGRNAKVILWTGDNYQHENKFLVAVKQQGKTGAQLASILEVSLPVFYTADPEKPFDYAFNFDNVKETLVAVGQAEATRYFASTDFITDISSGREQVAVNLYDRIQKACDRIGLGIKLVGINMHDAHPPIGSDEPGGAIDVAGAFQDVVCAQEDAVKMISKANEYSITTVESAKVEATRILGAAEAYKYDTASVALADASRFESQLESYRHLPGMFKLRTYLDFLENDCSDIRKYIISNEIDVRNLVLNLEEKPSLDLLNTDINLLTNPQ